MKRIITIGREFGSGGRELGRRLSEQLGIAYYDKEIVSEIAKRTALSEEYVQQIMEHRPLISFPITIGRSFSPVGDAAFEQSQAIFRQQHEIIQELAQKSDCVIVGRCGDYILRDLDPLRIFVYADMESRMERCRSRAREGEDLSDKALQKMIRKVDKERKQYYEFYTGLVWGDRLNYDLCVNTGSRPLKDISAAVARLIGG